MTLDELLRASRAGVRRLGPHEVIEAAARGALVVDTRTDAQRRRQGELPRDLLPGGYSSSLAAASLRAIGLPRATDLEGGVEAWLAAGLPTEEGPADVRE
jgi:rhodanese-related sulfurtransferase